MILRQPESPEAALAAHLHEVVDEPDDAEADHELRSTRIADSAGVPSPNRMPAK